MKTIFLGVEGMTLENLVAIAQDGAQVQLTADAEKQIQKSRSLIESWVQEEKTIYGLRRPQRCHHIQRRYPTASKKCFDEPCRRCRQAF